MGLYIPKHFAVHEFVPPEIYKSLGDAALKKMDEKIVRSADQMREFFGASITINNWYWDGDRLYSGWRPDNCPIGAPNSMHKKGMAIDCIVAGIKAARVRTEIIKNRRAFPFITRLESGVSWVHLDCKPTGKEEIVLFNP